MATPTEPARILDEDNRGRAEWRVERMLVQRAPRDPATIPAPANTAEAHKHIHNPGNCEDSRLAFYPNAHIHLRRTPQRNGALNKPPSMN
jgi:hypothetical protein